MEKSEMIEKNLIVDLTDIKYKDTIPWINYGNKFDN